MRKRLRLFVSRLFCRSETPSRTPTEVLFKLKAYRFDSKLDIREMIRVLNALGLWRFIERDSDRWGVYTSSLAARPETTRIRIMEDEDNGGFYIVNIRYESESPDAQADWDSLHRELMEKILPAVGAANIQPIPDVE